MERQPTPAAANVAYVLFFFQILGTENAGKSSLLENILKTEVRH